MRSGGLDESRNEDNAAKSYFCALFLFALFSNVDVQTRSSLPKKSAAEMVEIDKTSLCFIAILLTKLTIDI